MERELLKLWHEFIAEWVKDPANRANLDILGGELKTWNPQLHDFMNWLELKGGALPAQTPPHE